MPDSSREDIERRASSYAERHQIAITAALGYGKDGTVYSAMGRDSGPSAIKSFGRREPFERERAVYERLASHGIGGEQTVLGHSVPMLRGSDDSLLVLEMTLVERPFVLDFASATLDEPPAFPEEVWVERLAHYREIFGDHWPTVRQIVAAFGSVGVHLLDLSLNNIGFPVDPK